MKPKKVLVVDDEAAIRTLFIQILEKEGFSVVTADNGLEALAVLQIENPDVVFLDLDMPKMGGIETIGHIRPQNPVPIIVLTGQSTQENVIQALTSGANDFLVKSEVTLGIIRARITRALNGAPRKLPAPAPASPTGPEEPSVGMREKIEAKLKKVVDLKALPFIATEIIQLAASPGSDAAVLTETISRDPAIAARVLLLANSAFYAVHGRIQNLTQAVTRIGFRGIHHVALAAAVMEEYRGTGRATGLDRIEFWKHSLACAVLGRELAAGVIKDADQIETAFLAGLLHDIGKAVLDENFHETYASVLAESSRKHASLHDHERKAMGIDHAEVARRIIVKWNLPEALLAPIVGHHAPLETATGSLEPERRLSVWIRAANTLAKALGIGFGGDATLEEIPDSLAAAAGLTAELVGAAVEKAPAEVTNLTQVMLLHGAAPALKPAAKKEPAQGGAVTLLREGTPIVDPLGVLLKRLGVQLRSADSVADALKATDLRAVIVRASSEAQFRALTEAAGQARRSAPLVVLADSPPDRGIKDKLKPLAPTYLVAPYSIRAVEKAVAD